jgi:shikimate dehydrogenase
MAPTEPWRAGVVGSPVAHSLSPVLHLAAYRELGLDHWSYDRIECDAAGLPALVASLGSEWAGLSVTMPGKYAALSLASSVSSRAAAVGAANTLVQKDSGVWHADCSDVDGVVGALTAAGEYTPAHGDHALVLGAGGTACAALAGLAELGIRSVTVAVRDPARADAARTCAGRLGLQLEVVPWSDLESVAAPVLVSTVPSAAVESQVDTLARSYCVLDVIYHPWPTPLALAVQRHGGKLATGLDMLLHQAFAQVEQFTGRPAPREAMRAALRAETGNVLALPIDPDERLKVATVVDVAPYSVKVVVEEYNPAWPAWFSSQEAAIHTALGAAALRVEHAGSTSVPGLPAKPVIDVILLVPDPADEPAYVPAMEAAGYTLRVREPDWYEHRMLTRRTDDGDDYDVNVHVFAPDALEVHRMLTFRDWLRTHDDDRDVYAATKRDLATRDWKYVQHYADAKTAIVNEILARATTPPA